MARAKTQYVCSGCSAISAKWAGRCPRCKEWNTLEEQAPVAKRSRSLSTTARPTKLNEIAPDRGGEARIRTGVNELDRVLGGGLVHGSLVLVGGDPGVGKSTLLLTSLASFAHKGLPTLYVSAEESLQQIRLRAERLGLHTAPMHLLAHTDMAHIEQVVRDMKPAVVVIDSVQTVHHPDVSSLPGSPSQVREVAHKAMLLAKHAKTSILLVGHVTKSGELAGPKVLEHFVDTVLHFEGDGRSNLRILRSLKNRFGPAGELGVFEMAESGLVEVPDASARLLKERVSDAPGTAVTSTLEGSRPLLAEVQALVGRPGAATPARTCVGVDRNRVLMLAAVLGKSGLDVHDKDLFVNAAGGLRLQETGVDLAIVAAMASSALERPLPEDLVLFGEIGLVGELRSVPFTAQRLREAARHGFRQVVLPAAGEIDAPEGLSVVRVRTAREALRAIFQMG